MKVLICVGLLVCVIAAIKIIIKIIIDTVGD